MFFFLLFLLLPTSHLLIPKSHSRKNGGESKIVYFVKCDQFRAEDFAFRRLCVSSILLFRSAVPVFKSPPLPTKSQVGTSQKPTQFGSELAVFAHMRPRI